MPHTPWGDGGREEGGEAGPSPLHICEDSSSSDNIGRGLNLVKKPSRRKSRGPVAHIASVRRDHGDMGVCRIGWSRHHGLDLVDGDTCRLADQSLGQHWGQGTPLVGRWADAQGVGKI